MVDEHNIESTLVYTCLLVKMWKWQGKLLLLANFQMVTMGGGKVYNVHQEQYCMQSTRKLSSVF